jgi:hypothetical protein
VAACCRQLGRKRKVTACEALYAWALDHTELVQLNVFHYTSLISALAAALRWERALEVSESERERERGRGPGGLSREVETPLPSNSPHYPMILREDLVGSHGRWKRPCLQTAHMTL